MTKEQFKKWDELKSQITELREKNVICKYICNLIDELEKQMSNSEKPNKWIKVSEDMPIIGQNVLVCDFDGDIYITSLHLDGTWGFDEIGNKIKNIVAWMELPEPYKAESEG